RGRGGSCLDDLPDDLCRLLCRDVAIGDPVAERVPLAGALDSDRYLVRSEPDRRQTRGRVGIEYASVQPLLHPLRLAALQPRPGGADHVAAMRPVTVGVDRGRDLVQLRIRGGHVVAVAVLVEI